MMLLSALELVSGFCKLVDTDQNYKAASALLHEEHFKFTSPIEKFQGRDQWLRLFPSVHKNGPIFEEPQASSNDLEGDFQVTRKGFKKMAFFTVQILETYKVDETSGKIVAINAALKKK